MKSWITVVFMMAYLATNAQNNRGLVRLEHYAVDSFVIGNVKLRSGEVSTQRLNYNLITKEMIFEQAGRYLAIANPENVDTVLLGNRVFVPADKGFYEWLGGTAYPFFVEHSCAIKEPGAPTGFGSSNTTASVSLRSLINEGGAYGLKLPDEFKVIPSHALFVRKDGKYYKIKNEKQLISLLPEKKQLINEWIKINKTNFSKNNEVALLAQQLQ